MSKPRKTHTVLDLHYHPDEGQGCFDGSYEECMDYVATQSPHFMYKVVPMSSAELAYADLVYADQYV